MRIDLTKLPDNTNNKYIPFYKNDNRYLVLYGSAASGKSYFIAQKIIYRILTEHNHRFLIVRKVARTLRHSVFQSIIDILSQWKILKLFKVNKSEMTITYTYSNSTIIFLGVDDVEKLKSIAGVTSVFIEEATELTADEFHQIDLRLRGETSSYKQIMLAFNPISINNWVKDHWFDNPKKDALVIKTTYLDNRYIDEQYKQVLESLKSTNYELYKVYALGEFGLLKGVIYPQITIVDNMPDNLENKGVGIDWGFVDPTVIVRGGFIGNDLYLDEILHRTDMITRDIIKFIPKETYCYADSAEKDRITECTRSGLWVQPAIKEVIAGINRVKSFNIHITKRSINLIKDLQVYSWKKDKDGNELEVPNHFHSDGCFSGSTLVEVNNKIMRFDEIPRTGVIKGHNNECVSYVNGGFIKYDELLRVKLVGGIIIEATPDHKFLTLNGWVSAHKLTGEVLCTSELYQKHCKSSMEQYTRNIKSIIITSTMTNTYIGRYMSSLLENVRLIVISITKTIIERIMSLGILKQYQCQNILVTTQKNISMRTEKQHLNNSIKSDHLLKNGIKAKRAEYGTKITTSECAISYTEKFKRFVSNAVKHTYLAMKQQVNSAQTNAKQHIEDRQGLTMSREYVFDAIRNSQLADIQNQYTVGEVVLPKHNTKKEKTYCVTVPSDNCFALHNGLIVSNCDAIRYYVHSSTQNKINTHSLRLKGL